MKVCASLLFAALASPVSANTFSDACDGKSVGDDCLFELPDGSSIYGSCFEPDSPSACGPEYVDSSMSCIMCGDSPQGGGGGSSSDGQPSAPKVSPSVAACADSAEGATCGFTTADGTKMSGTCVDQGAGACGPIDSSADSSVTCYVCASDDTGGSGSGPTNSGQNECSGLNVGDQCEVVRGTDSFLGECVDTEENKDTGDGKLACEPIANDKVYTPEPGTGGGDSSMPEISTALQDACSSKSSGATCSYTDPATSKTISGVCEDDGSGTLQCDNEDATSGGSGGDGSDPLVDACSSSAEGNACSVTTDEVKISGVCTVSDAGDLFCAPSLPTGSGTDARHLRH